MNPDPATSRLRITVGPPGLVLAGELDRMEHVRLLDAVTSVARSDPGGEIGIDATEVTFIDSGGIRALLICRDEAVQAGSRLSIVAAGPVVRHVLEVTGLREVLGPPTTRQASV
ncbi:STAS domain-containing protein [Actinoplanes sp. NPDC023801]|uniref:STAS domain-containing protein n=1 Tax=Actinoplanes sp. NPDC023801 TaxID=3154595 RepID=UPI0033FE8A1E